MGNYIGGDTLEVNITHPVEGLVTFQAKAAEDTTYDLGGVRVADEDNGVTGSGTMISSLNRKRWKVPVLIAADMNTDLDVEKVNRIAASTLESTMTISNLNGSIYKGTGRVVGEIVLNTNKSTCPITLSGGGKLTKIA
jgi:hypothetical protein